MLSVSPLTLKATLAVNLTQYHFLICSCLTNSAMTPGCSHHYTIFTSPLSSKNKLTGAWKHNAQGARLLGKWHHSNILLVYMWRGERRDAVTFTLPSLISSLILTDISLELFVSWFRLSLCCHFLPPRSVFIPLFLSVPTLPCICSIFYLRAAILSASITCTRLLKTLTAEKDAAQGQFPECCSPLALI